MNTYKETAIRVFIDKETLKKIENKTPLDSARGDILVFETSTLYLSMGEPCPELKQIINSIPELDNYDYLIIDA